jgi:hypothetical protein
MHASTALSKVFGFKNQLDRKQYEQMVAPAFVCSSDRLKSDLGFAARHGLADTLANAADCYERTGWL